MEEVSVIKFVDKDLNNKGNLIGQNGLKAVQDRQKREKVFLKVSPWQGI